MDKIIQQLAIKHNVSEEIVTKIIRSQFLFTKDTMEAGNNESVQLPYFGKFACKKGRLEYLEKLNERNQQ